MLEDEVIVLRVSEGQVEVSGKQPWQREGLGAKGFHSSSSVLSGYIHLKVVERRDNRLCSYLSTTGPLATQGVNEPREKGDPPTASTCPRVGRLGLRGLQNLAYQAQATSALLGHTLSWPTAHSRGKEMRWCHRNI